MSSQLSIDVPKYGLLTGPDAYSDRGELNTINGSEVSLPMTPTSPSAAGANTPPAKPARSPLRSMPRSISSSTSTTTISTTGSSTIVDNESMYTYEPNPAGLASLDGIIDALSSVDSTKAEEKSLPPILDSELEDGGADLPTVPLTPSLTKRTHVLLELLSSERAHASDLALIRDIHIPLALGQPAPFHTAPVSPPPSSGSSSRTVSTASDSSTSSNLGPPMTREDTKIIFSNVPELALFSDIFTEQMEDALGSVLQGGEGEDHVGRLFLEIIPKLEPPYKLYITRHPTAVAHLSALPQTPALTAYLAHTRTLASSLTHAWDLASLLIKPVQRLLKYPLLLQAIIDETPDSHSDKANLLLAKEKMEEVARGVNEGRRRYEIVKEVLTSKPGDLPKKKGVGVGVAASVNLGRMRSLRTVKAKEGNEEEKLVEKLGRDLKKTDAFITDLAKAAIDWCGAAGGIMRQLRVWALGFGKVIGLSDDQQSEAFDAFVSVVQEQLMPLCTELELLVKDKLLRELARLVATTHSPLRLLEAMNTLEPLHYGLLNINFSKNRPPAALLEASQSYLALRGQLFQELPLYMALLHKGITASILQLGVIQTKFYQDVRDRWSDLWDALRVDGEMNAGAGETLKVWWERWAEVDRAVASLNVVNPPRRLQLEERMMERMARQARQEEEERRLWMEKQERERYEKSLTVPKVHNMLGSLEPTTRLKSQSSVHNMLAALEPSISPPMSLTSPNRTRSRGGSDAGSKQPRTVRRGSDVSESTRSAATRSTRSGRRSSRSGEEIDGFVALDMPMPTAQMGINFPTFDMQPSRTRSAGPIPNSPPPASLAGSSIAGGSARMKMGGSQTPIPRSAPPMDYPSPPGAGEEWDRGRPSRKPSLRRKLTDFLPRERRSSSSKSLVDDQPGTPPSYTGSGREYQQPMPSNNTPPRQASRGSWEFARAKYACRVVHACYPPNGVSYYNFPFFRLQEGEVYEVLKEAGHPCTHENLPLYVDDGEDCLLLLRSREGTVGWGLASFLIPEDYLD